MADCFLKMEGYLGDLRYKMLHKVFFSGNHDWFTGRLEDNMLTITEVKEGFYPGSMLLLRVLIVIMV